MKYLLMLIIQVYWTFIPASKRKKCIFKKSCSNFVFETTKREGFIKGLAALLFRYKNCRGGFQIFKNPLNNEIQMILPSKIIISQKEIAERFI